jgi:bacteriocin-like protein
MNVQETAKTTAELGIRELTITELEQVSGGVNFAEWFGNFTYMLMVRAIHSDPCWVNCH